MAEFRNGLISELFELTKRQPNDLTLICQDGDISVHKMILASASPVLKNLFLRHGNLPYVNLIDVESIDLVALLRFIYDGVEENQLQQEGCVRLSKLLGIAVPACQPQVTQHDVQIPVETSAINNNPSEVPVTPILILKSPATPILILESPATGSKVPDPKETNNEVAKTVQEAKKTVTFDEQLHFAPTPDMATTFVRRSISRRRTTFCYEAKAWPKRKTRSHSEDSSLKPSTSGTPSSAAKAKKPKIEVEDLCSHSTAEASSSTAKSKKLCEFCLRLNSLKHEEMCKENPKRMVFDCSCGKTFVSKKTFDTHAKRFHKED